MAKEVKIFNATKKIGCIVFNYNKSFDESFVNNFFESFTETILELKKKKIKIDLNGLDKGETLNVYLYPTVQQFNKKFYSEIDRRFHSGKKSVGDIYMIQTEDGDIHVTVPRGRGTEVTDALQAALVAQILKNFTAEKDKLAVQKVSKDTVKNVRDRKNKKEIEEEPEEEPEEEIEEELDEEEPEEEIEELDEDEMEDLYLIENTISEDIEKSESESNEDERANKEKEKIEKEREKEIKNREAKSWLVLGFMAYRTQRLNSPTNFSKFSDYLSKRGVTKFSKLRTTKVFENSLYEREQACAFVDFLINTFGRKNFLKVYEDPSRLKQNKIFGLSKFVFDSQAKAYIMDKYRMKAEKEKDTIKEVVGIDESKDGVIDTTTVTFEKGPILAKTELIKVDDE